MDFPLTTFARHKTPFYYYDMSLLRQTLEAVASASDYPGFCVHYAVKANSDESILRLVSSFGFGADTVSGGEVDRAIACGFLPRNVVFAGVGKTDGEIESALMAGIGCFNVESAEELYVIEQIANRLGRTAPVAFRVNPGIDAHTHHYITTGLAENKFGIEIPMLKPLVRYAIESDCIEFRGFHFHIGSQITTLEPFRILCERIKVLRDDYEADGIELPTINVGGGLGVDYEDPDANPIPDFESYFRLFHRHLELRPGQQLHFELGRSIVAQCGALISRVLYVKQGLEKRFVIIDAGFTELLRPALYGAHHLIQNLTSHATDRLMYDVVGPICESSDTFGTDELLPLTSRGDLLALRSAGAYGEIMASGYNLRSLNPSVFSSEK